MRRLNDGNSGSGTTGTAAPPSVSMVAVADLWVDHDYQRPLREEMVDEIVRTYRPTLFSPLLISRRENPNLFGERGKFAVIDGQHRLAAARRLGMCFMPCIVTEASPADEARQFVECQSARRPVNLIEQHRAEVCAGEPRALEIDRAVKTVGAYIGDGGQMAFRCMKALHAGVQMEERTGRTGLLIRTLRTLIGAWPTSEVARNGSFVNGVLMFFAAYWDEVNDQDVIGKFMVVDPRKVMADISLAKAGGGTGASNHAARVFSEIYNAKRQQKNRLDLQRLEALTRALKGRVVLGR